MHLTYQNLTVRNAAAADAAQLAKWWNDGRVMAHAGFPNGLGCTAESIAESLANDSDETHRRHIIEADGRPIGETNYRNIGNHTAEIGIKICEETYQNGGLGKKILTMLIAALFQAGYKKIVLDTNLKNTRAQHVYEQLGFQKLRVNVDAWRDQVGELQSSVDYELTDETFVRYQ